MELLILVLAGIGIYYWIKASRRKKKELEKKRRDALILKYNSEEIADKIIAKQVWQGMNLEQLIDSWGTPLDTDDTVFKTKTKSTWKYGFAGKNRYRQKVMIENSVVVGWETK